MSDSEGNIPRKNSAKKSKSKLIHNQETQEESGPEAISAKARQTPSRAASIAAKLKLKAPVEEEDSEEDTDNSE